MDNIIPDRITLHPPENETGRLINAIASFGTPVYKGARKRLSLKSNNKKVVYILKSGYLSYRFAANHLVASYVYSHMIIGLGEIFSHNTSDLGYFLTESNAELIMVDEYIILDALRADVNLWNDIAYILSYVTKKLVARDINLGARNAYQLVRALLLDLFSQPIEIRNCVTVVNYILERSLLSKSSVMGIIAQLKRGGYVTTDRGILVTLNTLPEHY